MALWYTGDIVINKLLICGGVLVGIAGIAIWASANPQSGAVPGARTDGWIKTDSANNVGIKTNGAPATPLDVNGAATVRGALDMAGSRIANVAWPTAGSDAATKEYADMKIVSATAPRLWGRGRPGTTLINASAGECTNTAPDGAAIKISRNLFYTTWASAANGCPAGWWVCTGAERDVNGSSTSGYGTCGTTVIGSNNNYICATTPTGSAYPDDLGVPQGTTNNEAWISNANITAGISVTRTGGLGLAAQACDRVPVWCCSYR
jgi:hypothetical protein